MDGVCFQLFLVLSYEVSMVFNMVGICDIPLTAIAPLRKCNRKCCFDRFFIMLVFWI